MIGRSFRVDKGLSLASRWRSVLQLPRYAATLKEAVAVAWQPSSAIDRPASCVLVTFTASGDVIVETSLRAPLLDRLRARDVYADKAESKRLRAAITTIEDERDVPVFIEDAEGAFLVDVLALVDLGRPAEAS